MTVAHALGHALVRAGITHGFGVVGSGNFHLTRAFADAGGRFTAARHEGGAATMADAYARTSRNVSMLSVHQGCGYTNAITGIAEAAKSRTPLVVLAPAATDNSSNFFVDQASIARSVGAQEVTLSDPATAATDLVGAVESARRERHTTVVNLPITVLGAPDPGTPAARTDTPPTVVEPSREALEEFAQMLADSQRPVFIAGRGAQGAREQVQAVGDRVGALFATSAVSAGLFAGSEWNLGISGGFSSPEAAELIANADLVVAWGCSLNMWTTRHGALISPQATVVQVDDTATALGRHRPVDLAVHGSVQRTAEALGERLPERARLGYRSVGKDGLAQVSWLDVPYEDAGDSSRIDPRTLTRELNRILPQPRVLGVDSGNFMGYPAMFFEHADESSMCFTQAFQSIGLGLATAIGAAIARPDRLAVAALGDGGAAMGIAELETVVRLHLPMVVIVYNDAAYSAEVHHFAGENHEQVLFPDVDFAAVAQSLGFDGVTVRSIRDLAGVRGWLAHQDRPLLIDAKIAATAPSWWLAEAFGH